MLFHIPFVYEALIIERQGEEQKVVPVCDLITVAIKEMTDTELPVAFEVLSKTGAVEDAIRWDGRRLWHGLKPRAAFEATEEISVAEFQASVEHLSDPGQQSRNARPFEGYWSTMNPSVRQSWMRERHGCTDSYRQFSPATVKRSKIEIPHYEWIDDNHDVVASEAYEIAHTLRICGDRVLTRCREPYYQITRVGENGDRGSVILEVKHRGGDEPLSPPHAWYGDQLDQAIKARQTLADKRKHPLRDSDNSHRSIRVLMPQAIQRPSSELQTFHASLPGAGQRGQFL